MQRFVFRTSRWHSHATFLADDRGHVDVSRTAPIAGTYEGVAAMAFIWSAEELPGVTRPSPPDAVMHPWFIDLEAEAPDGRRARTTIERRVAGRGVTRREIRADGVIGTLFLPPGEGPHPAVIVLRGGDGGIDEVGGAILASRGYAALALGYFRVDGRPSAELADIALRRLEAHRHPFPFQHLKYEGAGHLIRLPYIPTTVRATGLLVQGFEGFLYSMGGSPKRDALAGIDAWRQHLQFLEDARHSHGRRAGVR